MFHCLYSMVSWTLLNSPQPLLLLCYLPFDIVRLIICKRAHVHTHIRRSKHKTFQIGLYVNQWIMNRISYLNYNKLDEWLMQYVGMLQPLCQYIVMCIFGADNKRAAAFKYQRQRSFLPISYLIYFFLYPFFSSQLNGIFIVNRFLLIDFYRRVMLL